MQRVKRLTLLAVLLLTLGFSSIAVAGGSDPLPTCDPTQPTCQVTP